MYRIYGERMMSRDIPMLIRKLTKDYNTWRKESGDEPPTRDELNFYDGRPGSYHTVMFMPHVGQWKQMMILLEEDDILCDMGAGDLRFALMASQMVKKVYAVELVPEVIQRALKAISWDMPRNLIVVCSDWTIFPVPEDVTVITCMVNISPEELPEAWFEGERRVYLGMNRLAEDTIYQLHDDEEEKSQEGSEYER